MAKKIEEYLHEVNYDFPEYVPSKDALDFINFIKLVNMDAGGEENKTPVVHAKLTDNIFTKTKRDINMFWRGAGKTTVAAEYLFLYIGFKGMLPGFGKIDLALYVSDSMENGVINLMNNVETRYENSSFLKEHIPNFKKTAKKLVMVNSKGDKLTVKGYGAKTGVRGTKEDGKRPQLAVLDDLLSDEDANSDAVIASIENTVHKAVSKAMHPAYSKTLWLGTPFHEKDPFYKAAGSGAWNVNVFPVCEKFDSKTTEEDFKGGWEDRFTYEYVKDEYESAVAQGMVHAFDQEMMLRIVSDDQRMLRDSDFTWYIRDEVLKNKSNYNFYITTDFATSEKKTADFSVISVWAINNNMDRMLVDLVLERQQMDNNVDDLFRLTQMYKPLNVGIEVTGQQGGFISWIKKEQITRNTFFNIEEIRPTVKKYERFMGSIPIIKQKKIWFPEELKDDPSMKEAISELLGVTKIGFKSAHDDFLDTVSSLELLNLFAPSTSAEYQYNSESGTMDEVDDFIETKNPYLF